MSKKKTFKPPKRDAPENTFHSTCLSLSFLTKALFSPTNYSALIPGSSWVWEEVLRQHSLKPFTSQKLDLKTHLAEFWFIFNDCFRAPGLVVLLIIVVICCCISNKRRRHMQVKGERRCGSNNESRGNLDARTNAN